MTELLRFVLLGLGVGAIYALTAQGLVLIYRGSGVVNFAQGGLAMISAFVYYRGTREYGWPTWVAWVVALAVPAILGVLTHLLVMARLRRASSLVRVVATLGLFFLMIAVATELWGSSGDPVSSPLPTRTRLPFGAGSGVGEDRLWLVAIAVAVTAVLSAVFRWTRLGHATEAVAENPVAASSLGYSPDKIAMVNWAAGGALAGLAGILVAPILFLNVAALAFTVLRALAAALVGSFRSFWLTFAGAMGIGVIESVLSRYIEDKGVLGPFVSEDGLFLGTFASPAVYRSAAFLVIVFLLVSRGRALPLRSELLDRLPAVGTGRVNAIAVAVGVGAMVLILLTVPDDWATAFVVSMATAIVCLSLVVVIGFVGQLSLAQMALAGFGAWVAGRLATTYGWSFIPAMIVGALAVVPLGVLVALPATRTRGINLAVLTFGLSVVIGEMVLGNSALTGGFEGTKPEPPTLFGLEIDAFSHPGRYGLVVLVVLTLLSLMVANLRRGRSGLRLLAVRSNERAAAALGVSVPGAKVYAFGLGAAIAGFGGILLAFRSVTISYPTFGGFASIQVVVQSVIGGIGFVIGPLFAGQFAPFGIGARVVKAFGFEQEKLDLISGALLVLILFANPNGMAYASVRAAQKRGRRPRRSRPVVAGDDRLLGNDDAWADDTARRAGATLEIEHLTVRFGGVVAVDDVSLSIHPGEVVGLIGPNGAGKTTVIEAVTGFASAGQATTIRLGDVAVDRWTPTARARAGLGRSFQTLELFEDITVRENLLVACDDRSRSSYVTDLVRPGTRRLTVAAGAAVREFGLADDLDRMPDELSNGRRRLVAIARSIAASPSVLLLDEPAAGLTTTESAELGRLIRRLASEMGLAVLLIEHDVGLVLSTCDRVAVLDFGRLIALGTPTEITADPAVIAAYLGEPEPDGAQR